MNMKLKKSQKRYIYERDGRVCRYCGKRLQPHQASMDHYMPKSKNGVDELFNVILSCKTCNKFKNNKIFDDWHDVMIEYFIVAVQDHKVTISSKYMSREEFIAASKHVDKVDIEDGMAVFKGMGLSFRVHNSRIKKFNRNKKY